MSSSLGRRRSRVSSAETITVISLLIAVVALAATSGCATARLARRAHLARTELTGLTRSELQACAGDPVRIEQGGGWQYLTYVSDLRPDQVRSTQCVATFMVKNGYVEEVDYENPTGGLIGKNVIECLPIVEPCLPKMENDPRD